MKLPFGTLNITARAKELINKALESGRFTSGKMVREFEERYADKVGTKHAVAVSSGTDALTVALAALYDSGAVRGGKVVMPALTFPATANAVLAAGFIPQFVDVKRETLTMDLADALFASTYADVEAILPVHLMGKMVDIPALMDEELPIIEDAAEAHGGSLRGVNAGAMGHMGCFSLYAAHIIPTIEGGIVTTNESELAARMRSLRADGRACNCKVCIANQGTGACKKRWETGSDRRFQFDRVGFSCKMNELEAAVGLGALDDYEEIIQKRHGNLMAMIRVVEQLPFLTTISEEPREHIGPHALPILLAEDAPFTRDELARHLVSTGIDIRNLFSSIPTQTKAYAWMGHELGEFPEAEYVGRHGLHLGCHQDVGPEHIMYFADVLAQFIQAAGGDEWGWSSPSRRCLQSRVGGG